MPNEEKAIAGDVGTPADPVAAAQTVKAAVSEVPHPPEPAPAPLPRVRKPKAQANREGLAHEPTWYKSGVIYQVHVRAFYDSNADGTGDFRGLT